MDANHHAAAHSVGRFTVHIGADGAIDALHQNGCKLSGIVSRFTPNVYNVHARFTACHFAEYNRRWSGTIGVYKQDGSLGLSLRSHEVLIGKASKSYDATGTLQRGS